MRWLFLLVLLFQLPCLTGQAPAGLRLTQDFTDVALLDAITHLEKQFGLRFSFPREPVEQATVNCRFENAGWETINQCLFAAHHLEAERLKNGYVTLRPVSTTTIREWSLCLQIQGDDGKPLSYATVGVQASGLGGNTDENGRFAGALKAAATDSLVVQYLGYEPQRHCLQDLLRESCPTLRLAPAAFELASVTVEEYLADGITATPDGRRVTFDTRKTPPIPGFAGTEVYRMLSLLPGINNAGETAGDLNIRGGSRDQNLILWDGIPIYTSGHYFSMISNFNAALIDEVNVWRGPAEAGYGGRVSGVVQLTTDREVVTKLAAGAEVNLLGANLHAKIPVVRNKSDVHLGLTSSIDGLIPGPTYQSYRKQVFQGQAFDLVLRADEGALDKTEAFDFTEFNGRWQYNFTDRHQLTLSGFTQRDDFSYTLSQGNTNRFFSERLSTRNAGLSLNYRQTFSGGQQLTAQVAETAFRNQGATSYQERRNEEAEQRRSEITETSVRLHYDFKPGQQGQFKTGLQAQRYGYRVGFGFLNTLADTSGTENIGDEDVRATALFGTYVWQPPQQKFRAEIGLRLQYYEPANTVYAEPRLSGSLRLHDDWLLKAGYGENHQFPAEIIFLNPQRVSATIPLWTLADGDRVKVLHSKEGSIGITGQPKSWLFEVEVYHKRVDGLSTFGSNVQNNGIVAGNALASGLDVLIKKRWKKWRSWAIYSLSKTDWRFPFREDSLRLGSESDYFPADNDRRHQLRLVNTYQHNNWSFSVGWRIHSGSRFTAPGEARLLARGGGQDPLIRLIRGPNNAETLPAFHRLDLSAFYAFGATASRGLKGRVGV